MGEKAEAQNHHGGIPSSLLTSALPISFFTLLGHEETVKLVHILDRSNEKPSFLPSLCFRHCVWICQTQGPWLISFSSRVSAVFSTNWVVYRQTAGMDCASQIEVLFGTTGLFYPFFNWPTCRPGRNPPTPPPHPPPSFQRCRSWDIVQNIHPHTNEWMCPLKYPHSNLFLIRCIQSRQWHSKHPVIIFSSADNSSLLVVGNRIDFCFVFRVGERFFCKGGPTQGSNSTCPPNQTRLNSRDSGYGNELWLTELLWIYI